MMLPLNLNLQLNATSALWANDSTLEILHKHILRYDQLKYKKEKERKSRIRMFFLWEGGVRIGLVVEGEDGHPGLHLMICLRLHIPFSIRVSS
jgi:hypothetical protein